MLKYKMSFSAKESKDLIEVIMEEYYKGMAPLKNIRFLGIIDEEFFDEFGETDKKYKIKIEVE